MPLRFAEQAAEAYRFPLTIRHLLDAASTTSIEQRIIYRDQSSYSYRDFVGRVGRLATMLSDAGVHPGVTVAILDWDSHRYLEAYFAVPMMGAVLQTVNVRLPIPQVSFTLRDAGAEVLLVHRDFFSLVDEILPSLPGVRVVIAIMDGIDDDLPAWAHGEFEQLSASASAEYTFSDFDEDAIATTFYTTGTTGNPKGVSFTHRQLVLHTLVASGPFGSFVDSPGLGVGEVYMPLTPMFHVHAWGMPYVATMLGLKQVYPGRYEPDLICRLRAEHKVTYSHCVPTVLRMILDAADRNGADLAGWKMTIGGSAMSKALFGEGRRRGMELAAGYGMSETAPMIAMARPSPGCSIDDRLFAEEMTASGVPVPLVNARIVDDAMNEQPHDGIARGELVLRAPWLASCYTGDPAASEALWRGGWLHTQDIATIDPAGNIQIRDRIKDVIKTGGEWIDSIQLEELIAAAEGVAEVSVIAVPDAKWGERPLAVIVAEKQASPTLEMLNSPIESAIARGEITRYAKLDRFEIVAQLARTSVGKLDKKLLRARFADPKRDVDSMTPASEGLR